MWTRRDWHEFYIAINKRERLMPPRPVVPVGYKRLAPAEGFSFRELDDAGITLNQAERLGLPVDAGRNNAYGPNVSMLRAFARTARQGRQWPTP